MRTTRQLVLFILASIFFVGCTSAAVKGRRDQRERMVKEGGKPYCEFMNGEAYPDIDIAVNLEMAKKCDPDKSLSVTSYKSPAETIGVMYCCVTPDKSVAKLDKKDDKMSSGGDLSLDESPAKPSKPGAPSSPSTTQPPQQPAKDKN